MFAELGCNYKKIINHLHNPDYVNKKCQDVLHDLNKNQKKKALFVAMICWIVINI